MWLVAGLGNPGAKYARNRHNIGFLAADALAGKLGAGSWSRKFQGEVCEAQLPTKCCLLKPQTFMNLSGDSVAAAARFYKIPPAQIIVLQDELDLPPGRLRVKQGGGAGGHNGIKSIDAHLGQGYWRVRLGIGHPGDSAQVSDYVLSDFSKAEWEVMERVIEAVAEHFGLLVEEDVAGFMNKVAREMAPPASLALPPFLTFPRKGGRDTVQRSDLQSAGNKEGEHPGGVDAAPANGSESLPPLRGKARKGGSHNLIPLARTLRQTMTDAERKLWYHLRRENLGTCKFRRQQPLGPYIVDFICLEKKLIIELDGSLHGDDAARDEIRTQYLAQTGHKVLRFWNNEVLENIDGVLQSIADTLEKRN